MRTPRHLRLRAAGGVLLALSGVWLGHAIEYVRVWGGSGLDRALTGPTHAYMVPVGVILGLAAALIARRAWASWHRLARRLDAASTALRRALRGQSVEFSGAENGSAASWEARIFSLAILLAIGQIALYVLQENLEALATHQSMPGLGSILGVHWAAALIQLDVAFVLLAAVAVAVRPFRARLTEISAVAALIRVLSAALRPHSERCARPLIDIAPRDWLGEAAWCRPPPRLLPAP
jgi:hypothetical protein